VIMRRVLLAIESTCDETAAALIDESGVVLGESVATQEEFHREYDGVVPEIAARAHLERIVPVIDMAMKSSGVRVDELVAVAVATFPGLPGSLLVGLSAAKALALAWDKPLVGINHIQAHVYACGIGREPIYPCVGFVVSGGHTSLYRCDDPITWEYLGGTIDDAAGEAFDKVAVMLGLPFPGGPELSKLAQRGDPKAIRFPRPLLDDSHRLDFSFSGLKTAVRYRILGVGKSGSSQGTAGVAEVPELLDEQDKADVAASFEQAVIDCLVGKAILAVKATGLNRLCIGGGVAANQKFRSQITAACASRKIELVIAKPQWCTDNAVMGALAWEKIRRGQFDTLELDAQPGLVRPEISRPKGKLQV
jgi:N6-L-threonylcarbamoyladenine synthase